ncbi:MAG: helix-turn-helix domain-containing protein [Chloroflexi bacterium]|nr:helix-turn-helix domain-containing protein [Chloroflexota bacterium]
MDDLLTTKQVQDLLKVDRTTIYRMLKDGRLPGIKIGQQWRFSRQEVEALLTVGTPSRPEPKPNTAVSTDVLPLYCVRTIQSVFAELAEVGVVTTDMDGNPLTSISNSGHFCNLIYGTESGQRACMSSWRDLAQSAEKRTPFVPCHAGLQYARARIEVNEEATAMLFAGQFYVEPPDPDEQDARVRELAYKHGLDPVKLAEAAQEISILDERKRNEIGAWLERVAHTFEHVGRERADLLDRLQRIADMSTFNNVDA